MIPSEIFLDKSWGETRSTASGEERTLEIPLPATPALGGIREVALVCQTSEKRGPVDVSLAAFQFVPFQPNVEQRVQSLLRRMTLEEKIGQLVLSASFWNLTGPSTKTEGLEESIRRGHCGNVFNARSVEYIRKLQTIAVEKTRLGIPLLFGFDVIHGYKTIFPISLGEAASWDLEAIRRSARVAATEASAAGLNWTFAPMVDIARDPRGAAFPKGAGEDPYLGCRVAEARVRGFQGDDLAAPSTILACVKHFAAYGAAQAGRDYHAVDISERTLREVYLPPFKAALDAGALSVMTSFSDLNGVPATMNRFLLQDVLRDEWGFRGFVVSDYTAINELVAHSAAENEREAARQAFSAGVDMDMQSGAFGRYLRELVSEKIAEAQIDDAVRRILRLKFMLGLFDDPYRYCDRETRKATSRCSGSPRGRLRHGLPVDGPLEERQANAAPEAGRSRRGDWPPGPGPPRPARLLVGGWRCGDGRARAGCHHQGERGRPRQLRPRLRRRLSRPTRVSSRRSRRQNRPTPSSWCWAKAGT